jgi:hypothetical protein
MSNLIIGYWATDSGAEYAHKKTVNGQQPTNDFQSTLEKEMHAGNATQTFSDLKMKMEDGKVIELKNCQRLHIEPVTVEFLQKKLGVSKEEAEKVLRQQTEELEKVNADSKKMAAERLIGLKKSAEHLTPEGYKKYLMFKEVKAIARDANGNIVAKLYKDGSFYCSNQLAGVVAEFRDGRSAEQAMQKIEKQSNVFVTHYQNKVTDFELMSEKEKQRVLSPELYSEERKSILDQISELEWSMANGGNGLSPLFGPHR